MAKRKPSENIGVPDWILTYGDLMSLLLCFFILLSAFSELKRPREYQKVIDSIKEALGLDGGLGMINSYRNPQNSMINHLTEHARMAGDVPSRSDINEQSISGRDQTVTTISEGGRWVVGGAIAFQAASAEISEASKKQLHDLAEDIRGKDTRVDIKGHAWGLEDKSGGDDYRELSFQRARAVVEFLETECAIRSERLTIIAAGNSEPKELDQLGGSQNRRVEVVVTEVTLAETHPDPDWQGN